jgi:SAM-dependent methyltransferase
MTDEIMRVLQPDGEFLISIPNRYFLLGGSPHWMPVFWPFLPKNIGLKLSRYVVDNQDYENYKNGFFPISSWSMRRFLENRFEKIEYITLELGRKFGNDVWPEWFNSIYPSLYKLTSYPGLRTIFEWCFGYVSYRVQYPKHD